MNSYLIFAQKEKSHCRLLQYLLVKSPEIKNLHECSKRNLQKWLYNLEILNPEFIERI